MTQIAELQSLLDEIRQRLDAADADRTELGKRITDLATRPTPTDTKLTDRVTDTERRLTDLEPPVPVSPSGEPMPTDDLPGWTLDWSEDFTTDCPEGGFHAAYPSMGLYYGPDTSKRGTYDPAILSVTGSVLRKRIHTTADAVHHVAAILPRLSAVGKRGDVPAGRFAVRWRCDLVATYKQAWLLWPLSGVWPRDGEIDFPERSLAETQVHGFVHLQGATEGSDQASTRAAGDFTQWHTTEIVWSPGLVVFILDGREIKRVTTRVPNTPMHWVLQTETNITRQAAGGYVPVDKTAAGLVEIDWLAYYSPSAA